MNGTEDRMKIKQVYIATSSIDRLADFYGRLGLPVRFADGDRWVQFQTEGAAFCIAGACEAAVRPSSNAVIVFEVTDLETALETARAAGALSVSGIRDMGSHGRSAVIEDVERNVLQFYQRAA